jgi:hypothetical protein
MVHLGDEAEVRAHFGFFADSANLWHKIGAQFASNVP